jgi:hypothetical protein
MPSHSTCRLDYCEIMRIATSILEVFIIFLVGWLVFPKLIFGMELPPILHGIGLAANLSLKHLMGLSAVVLLYGVLFINGGPGFVTASLSSLSPFTKGFILFALAFAVYLHAMPGHSGDTIPAKLIPISIVEEGDLDLDEFRYAIYGGHYYSMTKQKGHYYSTYPMFPGITVTPLYALMKWVAPDVFSYWKHEYSKRNGDLSDGVVVLMQHYSAAMVAAFAVVIFWLISQRLGVSAIVSVPATIAFSFGSPMMSSMASQLWTHGPAILFMLLAVFFSATRKIEEQTDVGLLLGGLAAAWSIACRPTGLIAASLLTLYVLIRSKRRSLFFILPFLTLLFGVGYLNMDIYGKIFGGYQGQVSHFAMPTVQRFFQLLISPSRGLLPFAPYVILLAFFIPAIFKRKVDLLTLTILAVAGELAIYTCWNIWWGGFCFGPRLLADCIMWCLLAILAANVHFKKPQGLKAKTMWLSTLVLVAYAVCLNITGAVYGDKNWTRDYFLNKPEKLMHWKNSQVIWTLTHIRYDMKNEWQKE